MFNWFKNLFKKSESAEPVNSAGLRLSVLPKVQDYPRSQYNAYWEIIKLHKIAYVRIYDSKGKLITYSTFEDNQKDPMDVRISNWLRTKMSDYKKKV